MKYYGVSQSKHGHEYRWIFAAKTVHDRLGREPERWEDSFFPLGGSNASATIFTPIEDDIEVVRFLLEPGIIDYEDPKLVDIGEYILTLGSDDELDDCTQEFLDKYGICDEAIINRYEDGLRHREKTLFMVSGLKQAGYGNFDLKNPFYGRNRDMRFSSLEELYETVVKH